MCGIVGVFKRGFHQPDLNKLAIACKLLEHRGPDDEGFFVEKSVAFGHRRLSIIDILSGHQPMSSASGRYQIVYNGEVYNFREIRAKLEKEGVRFKTHSDTEVILEAYVRYGKDCLRMFNGMFAFAIYDKKEQTLFLARDRLGVKPLFYYRDSSGFYFASEIPALLELAPVTPVLNPGAIDLYLSFRYINAPLTAIKDVFRVLPGHYMVVKDGRIDRYEEYWDINIDEPLTISYEEALERFRELFDNAVRLRLIADVPVGAFLSGGVDSSLVVASMAQNSQNVKTFSIGFREQKFNELPYAREIAEKFGTDHLEAVVEPNVIEIIPEIVRKFGEPFGNETSILLYYMSQVASEKVKVVLSGDGGDEAFAGYKRYRQYLHITKLRSIGLKDAYRHVRKFITRLEAAFNPSRRHLRFPVSASDMALCDQYEFPYLAFLTTFNPEDKYLCYNKNGPLFSLIEKSLPGEVISRYDKHGNIPLLTRLQYIDLKTYLPGDILYYVDVMSMANSLETRSPFLDHNIVDFALRLPPSYRLGDKKGGKRLLKDAFTDRIDSKFFERKKKGFSIPLAKWISGPLNKHIVEFLRSQNDPFYSLFDRKGIEDLLLRSEKKNTRVSKQLWNLYILANWLSIFNIRV